MPRRATGGEASADARDRNGEARIEKILSRYYEVCCPNVLGGKCV